MPPSILRLLLSSFTAGCALGCQTTTTKITPGTPVDTTIRMGGVHPPAESAPHQLSAPPTPSPQAGDPEQIEVNPSASRLHDICGEILLYFAVNREMPKTLSDLQSVMDTEVQLDTTSPTSHQPYVYAPQGLIGVGHAKRIIIYDPVPLPSGKRWCVFSADAAPGQAQSLEVVLTPESVFHDYVPSAK